VIRHYVNLQMPNKSPPSRMEIAVKKKNGRCIDSAEDTNLSKKKRQSDQWIKTYASHSSILQEWDDTSCPSTELHFELYTIHVQMNSLRMEY